MKIGHPADQPTAASGAPAAAETAKAGQAQAAAATAGAADPSATVALSSTAATLLSGGTSGEFDAEKVARMSEAIAGGSFRINAEAIADKLIANAQELLVKVKT
ncbi:MAG: flagellar biosynthesis anti-sigma factor FlgM [Caldimonas sp.]